MQCDEVRELSFAAVMLPGEDLSGRAAQFGKRFPKPWGGADCLLEQALQAAALGMGRRHQPAAVTPRGFTFPRMNSMMASIGVPGWKTAATPAFLRPSTSWSGMMPPTTSRTSSIWFCFSKIEHARHDGVVCARQDAESDDVHVFLERSVDDHLRGLAQASVDDFHSGIAQGARNDFGASIVAVKAGLGNQYANLAVCRHVGMLSAVSSRIRLNRE